MLNLRFDSHHSELLERTGKFSARKLKIKCKYTKINRETMMLEGFVLCLFQYSAYLKYSCYDVRVLYIPVTYRCYYLLNFCDVPLFITSTLLLNE